LGGRLSGALLTKEGLVLKVNSGTGGGGGDCKGPSTLADKTKEQFIKEKNRGGCETKRCFKDHLKRQKE